MLVKWVFYTGLQMIGTLNMFKGVIYIFFRFFILIFEDKDVYIH